MGLLTAAERERRRAALRLGRAEGLSTSAIAARLDITADSLYHWARMHEDDSPSHAEIVAGAVDWVRSEPLAILRSHRIRILPGPTTVTVECHWCRRAFTRPSRRAAERFARLHARLHPTIDREAIR